MGNGKINEKIRRCRALKAVIDRFEGNYAVCETDNKKMINVAKSMIPPGAMEGDVLIINGINAIIDIEETKRLKSKAKTLMEDVWEK